MRITTELNYNSMQQTEQLEIVALCVSEFHDVMYVYFSDRKKRDISRCLIIKDPAIKNACIIDCAFMTPSTVSHFVCVCLRLNVGSI